MRHMNRLIQNKPQKEYHPISLKGKIHDMNAAKTAFAEFLNDTNLDSRQIYFVNQIVEYIVHNGMMKDLSVLQEPPFTDQGSIVEVFTDLTVWMGIRRVIEQVNANALAA
jgi:type I restriction enzyme R subunit